MCIKTKNYGFCIQETSAVLKKTETAMKYTHLKTFEIIDAETASHLRLSSKIKSSK